MSQSDNAATTPKPASPPLHYDGADPLGHLMIRDTRTEEEKRAAQLKENARRKGRRTREWWRQEPGK